MTIEEVKDLLTKIEDAKLKSASFKGRIDSLLEQLQTEYNVSNLEEGLLCLGKMEQELKELQNTIDEKTKRLKEKYKI